MGQTEWIVEGDDDATLEVQGHKYATGDSGAPMLCSLLCETLGRHVHVDDCRPEGGKCVGAELKHIVHPKENLDKDWVTHRLFWARSGMFCLKLSYFSNQWILGFKGPFHAN